MWGGGAEINFDAFSIAFHFFVLFCFPLGWGKLYIGFGGSFVLVWVLFVCLLWGFCLFGRVSLTFNENNVVWLG